MATAIGSDREREAKLAAAVAVDLDEVDLGQVDPPGSLAMGPPELATLDAWYFDTPQLDLARRGVTLRRRSRHRSLDAPALDPPAQWTLKFPRQPATSGGLDRDELNVDDDSGAPSTAAEAVDGAATAPPPPARAVPEQLRRLVTAYVRSRPLEAVARLVTERTARPLLTPDQRVWAEIDDDQVTVHRPGQESSARFREIEIELATHAPSELLPALVEAARAVGAGPADPTPKLVRAMGPLAASPPELAAPDLRRRSSLADVVAAGMRHSVGLVLDHDHVVRLDDDPEGVHQARVGTRRLRSDLRSLAPELDADWAGTLRDELKWLGAELGAVRDIDVLQARLRHLAGSLPPDDEEAAGSLLGRLTTDRQRAVTRLHRGMASRRYVRLLDRLVEAAEHPRLVVDGSVAARSVLPSLVARPWSRLRRQARQLLRRPTSGAPSDDELHALRIRAKRARYAADLAAPVIGKPARGLVKRLGALQDELGDLHDTVVAEAWLRSAARSRGPAGVAAGLMIARLQAERAAHRAAWPDAWARVDEGRWTDWIGG